MALTGELARVWGLSQASARLQRVLSNSGSL